MEEIKQLIEENLLPEELYFSEDQEYYDPDQKDLYSRAKELEPIIKDKIIDQARRYREQKKKEKENNNDNDEEYEDDD